MKNKEKYEKLVLSFACDKNNSFGVDEKTGEMKMCSEMHCAECLFCGKIETCRASRREWLEQEHIEKPVISKRDRAFLEYLREDAKWMTKENGSEISVWMTQPNKDKDTNMWTDGLYNCLSTFNIDFPMVKLSDSKPWLIEDLKKLEVVEDYE